MRKLTRTICGGLGSVALVVSVVALGAPQAQASDGWDAKTPGWDARGWDAADAKGWDARGWDARGWDQRGWDAADAKGWDARGWDARGWDASADGWD